jgi:hypothetical protein
MTAHDQMRAMLDQLMGTARNGEEEKISVRFDDPQVCKSFLLGCCPHEILASTRMDLGDCPKLHNVALRADYEKAATQKDYFYDLDAVDQLSAFISDADRKTEQAKKRLAETQEELSTDVSVKADRVNELAEKIGESLAKAEQLGAEGFVDESMKLMGEIDELRKEKSEAEMEYRASIPAATYQQQKLRVCEVCCAYLGIHDNDRRLADHFGGKLHLGFIRIRETLKGFQAKLEERRRARREEGSKKRSYSPPARDRRDRVRRSRSRSPQYNKSKRERSRSRESRRRREDSHSSRHHHKKRHRSTSRASRKRKSSEEEAGEIV